jgi:hypothetical protein
MDRFTRTDLCGSDPAAIWVCDAGHACAAMGQSVYVCQGLVSLKADNQSFCGQLSISSLRKQRKDQRSK